MPTLPTAGNATTSRIRLGRIGPAVVLMCLLLDISLRFVPPGFVTYRAWEPMRAFAKGTGGFAPNAVYYNARSYGDLSNLSNRRHLRQYREERFTTDTEGYRNRHDAAKPFTGILLRGDSFVAGSGVSDELTLGEEISRISGLPVYNGAAARKLWELISRLQMTSGLVVWEQSERTPLPVRSSQAVPVRSKTGLIRRVRSYIPASWTLYSPLRIFSGRAVKFLQNDRILPNPYRTQAVAAKLRNGQEILFLPTELTNYDRGRPTDPAFFVQLKAELQQKGWSCSYCWFRTNT